MKRTLKILILEDMADEAMLIERVLKKSDIAFVSSVANSGKKFVEALDRFQPEVILSDHSLPQFNSIEALKICRKRGMSIPFILVTGTVSEEFAVNCLKQGIDDYILKDNMSRLPTAIINALNQREMESKKLAAERQLRDQNEKLLLANDALRKTNMELDNFVYSVSHNLRGPLTSVLGLVNIVRLENKKNGHHTNEVFNMIEGSILRLDETLKDILDYSRNARTESHVQLINFSSIFKACTERLKYVPNFQRIEKIFNLENTKPFYSDVYRVSVILHNLVSNSIRYQDITKQKSYLKIQVSDRDNQINITVSDNGIGIGKDQLPFIFNMFHRATERSEGAGLGLYIVKEAIEKLGGKINVVSQLNKGTEFKIQIPNSRPQVNGLLHTHRPKNLSL